jgi:hypothetical protein
MCLLRKKKGKLCTVKMQKQKTSFLVINQVVSNSALARPIPWHGESTINEDGVSYMGGLPGGHPAMRHTNRIEAGSSSGQETSADMVMTDTAHMFCVKFSGEEDEGEGDGDTW